MTFAIGGHCGKCGAPYTYPEVWFGVVPPQPQPTCACRNMSQVTTSASTAPLMPPPPESGSADRIGILAVEAAVAHAREEGRRRGVEEGRRAVDAEPELPGAMPSDLIAFVIRCPENAMRTAVRETKRGIAERLRRLLSGVPAPGNDSREDPAVPDHDPRWLWRALLLLIEQWEVGLGKPNLGAGTQAMHHCAGGLRRVMRESREPGPPPPTPLRSPSPPSTPTPESEQR